MPRAASRSHNCFSPSIPTTPGYGRMFTGRDCFGTNTVRCATKATWRPASKTLAEVLRDHGLHHDLGGL